MKPTKVKAWPELIDYLPSLPALRETRMEGGAGKAPVDVDFGSVRSVSSTGLTMFLLRLLRLLGDRNAAGIKMDCAPDIKEKLEKLGAVQLLGAMAGNIQSELGLASAGSRSAPTHAEPHFSLPVYRLCFEAGTDRRKVVNRFLPWLATQLEPLENVFEFESNGLVMLLNEIAKNAADHAATDAMFGFDVMPSTQNTSRLTFAFGDLGIGIKRHIEEHLPSEIKSRQPHMSLYEAYRLAIKPGYSSNPDTTLNKGHGMSIIITCAIDLSLHLSVFDASSRGLLNSLERLDQPTHSGLRRIFHHVGREVGFCYYGEGIITRRPHENQRP